MVRIIAKPARALESAPMADMELIQSSYTLTGRELGTYFTFLIAMTLSTTMIVCHAYNHHEEWFQPLLAWNATCVAFMAGLVLLKESCATLYFTIPRSANIHDQAFWHLLLRDLMKALIAIAAFTALSMIGVYFYRRHRNRNKKAEYVASAVAVDLVHTGSFVKNFEGKTYIEFMTADGGMETVSLSNDIVMRMMMTALSGSIVPPEVKSERVLEMSCPGSQQRLTRRPKFMAVIHNAPKGSSSLSGSLFGVINRVKLPFYGDCLVTCNHVLQDLANAGLPICIRVDGRDTPFQGFPILTRSENDSFDVAVLKVPQSYWAAVGLSIGKPTSKLTKTMPLKVYTPQADGTWVVAIGRPLIAVGSFKIFHSGSSDYGASGSAVTTGGQLCMIHTRRAPKGFNGKDCNQGTSLGLFYSTRTETPHQEELVREEEYDPREDYQERYEDHLIGKHDRRFLYHEDGGSYVEAPQTENDRWQAEQDWMDHYGYYADDDPEMGDYDPDEGLEINQPAQVWRIDQDADLGVPIVDLPLPLPEDAKEGKLTLLDQAKKVSVATAPPNLPSTPPPSTEQAQPLNRLGEETFSSSSPHSAAMNGASPKSLKAQGPLTSLAQPSAPLHPHPTSHRRQRRRQSKSSSQDSKTGATPNAKKPTSSTRSSAKLTEESKEQSQPSSSSTTCSSAANKSIPTRGPLVASTSQTTQSHSRGRPQASTNQ
jgi:hypothetical protein